jgi:signal peptidase I
MFKSSSYSLAKSRQVFKTGNKWYRTKRDSLTATELHLYERQLESLDQAIVNNNREEANRLAHEVETFYQAHFKKSIFDYLKELSVAIVVALLVAVVVRQMWFELYEIPTGSMRPTFEEQDRLTVTKTAFSLNIPLATKHFYFDPSLVQRGSVVIWSGDGVPELDSDSTFMGIFPYTKRYIKRCMGKPGDTLYFYGGKIYGLDQAGHDLVELREGPWLKRLDHVPFTYFEGLTKHTPATQLNPLNQVIFRLFNQAIARLRFGFGPPRGEVFNGKEWVEDQVLALREPHSSIQTYSDFVGIRNYAKSRLLTKEQLEQYTSFSANEMEEGILYLELQHTPSLNYPPPFLVNHRGGVFLRGFTTIIPLQEQHIQALREHLYTARFVVRDGRAALYRAENQGFNSNSPLFAQIPNGTYEFYYGKGYKIGWGGVPYALAADHPLYQPAMLQKLFNSGMEMHQMLEPQQRDQPFFPSRYTYFRAGDLYVMGEAIMKKEDPILGNFKQREQQREKLSTKQAPYIAFQDYGPPLAADGQLDQPFMKAFGYTIPEGHYLMLGDNHAMSQDSRWFGPIPQANLQGAPSLILWPPGKRWGIPAQKPYPLITLPRLIVWGLVGAAILAWWLWRRRQLQIPQFKKLT